MFQILIRSNFNIIIITGLKFFWNNFITSCKYKNHLIIIDNAVIHKSKVIRKTIENSDNDLLYSVPYYPGTNLIEEFFSQLKHYIKKESPNTYDDIYKVINRTINSKITEEHLTNYLKHSYNL
jgi:transposase